MGNIIDKQTSAHYTWGDQCDSWVLADCEGLSVKHESMPPGTKEQLHFHQHARQFFFILKGNASFYINNKKELLGEQQGIEVEPGIRHFIANETTSMLNFLVISQPATTKDRITV